MEMADAGSVMELYKLHIQFLFLIFINCKKYPILLTYPLWLYVCKVHTKKLWFLPLQLNENVNIFLESFQSNSESDISTKCLWNEWEISIKLISVCRMLVPVVKLQSCVLEWWNYKRWNCKYLWLWRMRWMESAFLLIFSSLELQLVVHKSTCIQQKWVQVSTIA